MMLAGILHWLRQHLRTKPTDQELERQRRAEDVARRVDRLSMQWQVRSRQYPPAGQGGPT